MGQLDFHDRFGSAADQYARFRPGYPPELFARIAQLAPDRHCVWDCATGSGQAAVDLAEHFTQVVATDASADQLAHARPHPRVDYRREQAEQTSLPDGSVDAVTVASALHWLNKPAFYEEVRRVGRPGALVAAWTYSTVTHVSDAFDARFAEFIDDRLGPYWTEHFAEVESGYRDTPFPFAPIDVDPLAIVVSWRLPDLLGYAATWSASIRYGHEHGKPFVDEHNPLLRAAWGERLYREVRIPVQVRMGRIPADPKAG